MFKPRVRRVVTTVSSRTTIGATTRYQRAEGQPTLLREACAARRRITTHVPPSLSANKPQEVGARQVQRYLRRAPIGHREPEVVPRVVQQVQPHPLRLRR